MSDDERVVLARALLDNPLIALLLDEMEMVAINQCINAAPQDHESRAAQAAEARAIRNFRRKLALALEDARAGERRAPV